MSKVNRGKQNIIAMIPARMGSTRLPVKNLALLKGKPLISYAIWAARDSGVFDRIVINSEDKVFSRVATRYGAEFYNRPAEWATSYAKSDNVVYDFIRNNPCKILVWVNSIAPLQTGPEIRGAVRYFLKNRFDSLITVKNENVHAVYGGKPVNFNIKGEFARTQDLKPVQPFVYSLMMWKTETFIRAFEKKGYAILCGKTGYYPVSKLSSVIIKNKEDLMMADALIDAAKRSGKYKVRYDRSIKNRKAGSCVN